MAILMARNHPWIATADRLASRFIAIIKLKRKTGFELVELETALYAIG